jgi:hypothetical protein
VDCTCGLHMWVTHVETAALGCLGAQLRPSSMQHSTLKKTFLRKKGILQATYEKIQNRVTSEILSVLCVSYIRHAVR